MKYISRQAQHYKLLALATTLVFTSFINSPSSTSYAQTENKDLSSILSPLVKQVDLLKSVQISFIEEVFNSESRRKVIQQRNVGSKVPVSVEGNVYSFKWTADADRWLCEKSDVVSSPIYSIAYSYAYFNGEETFLYNDSLKQGEILANQKLSGYIGGLRDNMFIGMPHYIMEMNERRSDLDLVDQSDDSFNGLPCATYSLVSKREKPGSVSKLKLWVDKKNISKLVGLLDVTYPTAIGGKTSVNGSATLYVASEFAESESGIYIPTRSRLELYDVREGKFDWDSTQTFSASSVAINPRLSSATFERGFPPGATIVDRISSPGLARFEGGEWPKSVEKVLSQQHPTPQINQENAASFLK